MAWQVSLDRTQSSRRITTTRALRIRGDQPSRTNAPPDESQRALPRRLNTKPKAPLSLYISRPIQSGPFRLLGRAAVFTFQAANASSEFSGEVERLLRRHVVVHSVGEIGFTERIKFPRSRLSTQPAAASQHTNREVIGLERARFCRAMSLSVWNTTSVCMSAAFTANRIVIESHMIVVKSHETARTPLELPAQLDHDHTRHHHTKLFLYRRFPSTGRIQVRPDSARQASIPGGTSPNSSVDGHSPQASRRNEPASKCQPGVDTFCIALIDSSTPNRLSTPG